MSDRTFEVKNGLVVNSSFVVNTTAILANVNLIFASGTAIKANGAFGAAQTALLSDGSGGMYWGALSGNTPTYIVGNSSITINAIFGTSNSGYGVVGSSWNSLGGYFTSNSGGGVEGQSNTSNGIVGISNSGYGAYISSNTNFGAQIFSTSGNPLYVGNNTNQFLEIYANGTLAVNNTIISGNLNSANVAQYAYANGVDAIFAQSNSGAGVNAASNSGIGMHGVSNSGTGIKAESVSSNALIANSGSGIGATIISGTGTPLYVGNATTQFLTVNSAGSVTVGNGTTASNGIYVQSNSGIAFSGQSNTSNGIVGISNSGYGGYFQSNTNYGLQAISNTGSPIYIGNATNQFFGVYSNGSTISNGTFFANNIGLGNTAPVTKLQIGGNYGVVATTVASTNNININCAAGNYFIVTANGSVANIYFTNVPANTYYSCVCRIANLGTNTVSYANTMKWPSGTAPTPSSNTDFWVFITENGGTSWYGSKTFTDMR